MRYLGIDYGKVRIGVALSDPGGRIAFPKEILRNSGNARLLEDLAALVETEAVGGIVVGLPLALDGSETEISREVRIFVEALSRAIPLPVTFENEIFTTHMVREAGIAKEHADAAAAALILQSYLDKQRNSSA